MGSKFGGLSLRQHSAQAVELLVQDVDISYPTLPVTPSKFYTAFHAWRDEAACSTSVLPLELPSPYSPLLDFLEITRRQTAVTADRRVRRRTVDTDDRTEARFAKQIVRGL